MKTCVAAFSAVSEGVWNRLVWSYNRGMKEFILVAQTIPCTEDGRLDLKVFKLTLEIDKELIGHLVWEEDSGEIYKLWVQSAYRRKGYATELWNRAKNYPIKPKHSAWRTNEGEAWALSTGDELPPREYA